MPPRIAEPDNTQSLVSKVPANARTEGLSEVQLQVKELIRRGRVAQGQIARFDQARIDDIVDAAAWAILEPSRNQILAELAVADTGIGNVADKLQKNYRKTFGLLRDLKGKKTVGVISENTLTGIVEIGRAVGVVAAITPSTNPGATPANKIINALKAGNAVIVAPSPKGWSTCARLIEFIHEQFDRIGAPHDLVQMLASPVSKESTLSLMKMADLVVATGSQANIKMAATSGTPSFGVGAGNVAAIVDESADILEAARKITLSKTFDNATSCSSENSVVVVASARGALLKAFEALGMVLLDADQKQSLQGLMFPEGKLSAAAIGQSASQIAERAGLAEIARSNPKVLLVEENGVGPDRPFSGEKLSPVLALYTAADFLEAKQIVERIYSFQGAGHSVSLHSQLPGRAEQLGLELPVSRVIVNQVHCVATGGAFNNGLPFSLSMGCGTWGGNNFSENMNVSHYMNITRVVRPIAERIPSEAELLGHYFEKFGRS
jgi:sulfoacetaldehyde dehydrogenase